MYHRKPPLAPDLASAPNVSAVQADLAKPETLIPAVEGVDAIVHFAGILFAPRPERFLPVTNTQWFSNLVNAALQAKVGRIILISFPHVEGPTTPDQPATGRLDREPMSVHAKTRLQEERLLFERTKGTETTPIVLRLGMVYGRGILMINAARWLAQRRLLGVWREPTWFQLISIADHLRAAEAAALKPGVRGIYHVGDEKPMTLQEFLDKACGAWNCRRPFRTPLWTIYVVASLCELFAAILKKPSPLTRDFITIGRVSHWGDTKRAREELIPELKYPTLDDGLSTL
jgi:nucleoside-diphosphate-sugar epimerase